MATEIDLSHVKTLSAIITDHLAEQIESGELKPGERLVQVELAKKFNVSRVAIRDALMELRRRGLSINVPKRGDIVRPVSCRTVRELFEIRRINESYAVQLSCSRIDEAGISKLRKIIKEQESCIRKKDIGGFMGKDWEFHAAIFEYCPNEQLKEFIQTLWARTRQARSVAQSDLSWGRQWAEASVARHKELLQALENRDCRKASDITARIIDEASKELEAELLRVGWDTGCETEG
ncbi:MAG: GntR family transcriptional regulator [Spirochaetes bacterium]|nr:GntR family transcriptional regulator [Spirochaetota bacterium]